MEIEDQEKIEALIARGVRIPNPHTLELDDDVDVGRISGEGVTIHAGCRLRGADTAIAAGCTLGAEAPVTLDNCQLGRQVALKGGFFREATFLDRANMGLGAQVREGTLLEEQANGAHTVGLKQTVLLPFVTMGSLINFCDALLAGGTSRKDHTEVGSSYIHFNFTPDADKATASLIGDVPRGVMLNQARIFLGGQGGLVGPVRIGYGNVIAAGTVYRKDCREEDLLLNARPLREIKIAHRKRLYPGLWRIFETNVEYIGNLHALDRWYEHVRRPFFEGWGQGPAVYGGARARLAQGIAERIKRLGALLEILAGDEQTVVSGQRAALHEKREEILERLRDPGIAEVGARGRDAFLAGLEQARGRTEGGYLATIQSLDRQLSASGTAWLQAIVDQIVSGACSVWPRDEDAKE